MVIVIRFVFGFGFGVGQRRRQSFPSDEKERVVLGDAVAVGMDVGSTKVWFGWNSLKVISYQYHKSASLPQVFDFDLGVFG